MPDENSWRGILAALANDTARRAYAEIVVGGASATLDELSPSRRRHVLDTLTAAGLVEPEGDGYQAPGGVFAEALRSASRPRIVEGPQKYLDGEGRIRTYPAAAKARGELLAYIAQQAVKPGEVLTETEVNERLSAFTPDVAVLRRYLVDHGELERTRSGSEYARPADAPAGD